jgi:hydroxymethylpyrimidine/phosphomethylpyrimidine kinase
MNLNQVTVGCRDLAESVRFYQKLGLRQIVSSPPDYARFECPDGGATFSLHREAEVARDGAPIVYFEVAALDAKVRGLVAQGVVFESEPRDQPWLWREAYLRDPAGNRICLYLANEARRYPPWRLPR